MNTTNLTGSQYRRFEQHVAYARRNGAALYNTVAPPTIIEGDDDNAEDMALFAVGLIQRADGYYSFTQHGWEYARFLHS